MPDDQALIAAPRRDPTGSVTTARPVIAPIAPHAPGFYLAERSAGFTLHLTASAQALRATRALVAETLTRAGVAMSVIEDVQLVVSELTANAVRACGGFVPLVVEVEADPAGVSISVHDPDSVRLPRRAAGAMPTDEESGRGLLLVDALAPGWRVVRTPTGKQVRCRVPRAGAGT
jgi:anti-sigma regulatory factor (Ser/Thr protein kinase)